MYVPSEIWRRGSSLACVFVREKDFLWSSALPPPGLDACGGWSPTCKTKPNVRVSSNLLVKLRNDGRCTKEGDVHVDQFVVTLGGTNI